MKESQHPITPPPELVQQWWDNTHGAFYEFEAVATQAARWGADQEFEACCEWVRESDGYDAALALRADRRPKPPSLKEQALEKLAWIDEKLEAPLLNHCDAIHIIRRALESLPD